MSVVNISTSAYQTVIKKYRVVVIDFWAGWCEPCKKFSPIFEAVADKYAENAKDVLFTKCNAEKEQSLAADFMIRSIPTIVVLKDGEMVLKKSGSFNQAQLEEFVAEFIA